MFLQSKHLRTPLLLLLAGILFVPRYSDAQQNIDTVRTGTLILNSAPSGVRVNIDGKNYGKTPLLVSPITTGVHRVILFDPLYENMTMELQIKQDDTLSITVPMQARQGMLSLLPTNTDGQYRYALNGRTIAPDSLSNISVPVGVHSLKVFSETDEIVLEEDVYAVAAQHNEYTIHMNKVNYLPMIMNVPLPGSGQLASHEYWKGSAFLAATLTTGLLIFDANRSYEAALTDYNDAKGRYDRGIGSPASLTTVQALRNDVSKTYDAMSAKYRSRSTYYFIYLGIVLLSELDIIMTHPTIHQVSFEVKPPKELKYPGMQEAFLPELGITIKL